MTTYTYLFPFTTYWWLYLTFIGLVAVMLILDLGVFHRKAHIITSKEAGIWTMVWITLALIFNIGLWRYASWRFPQDLTLMALPNFDPQVAANQVGIEFLTGYVIEKALAVENIFAFVLVFQLLRIPPLYQHRVLFFGIFGALLFRAIFIAMGAQLMRIEWVVYVFGAFLVLTGIKILVTATDEPDMTDSKIVKFLRNHLPISKEQHGDRFMVKEAGRWVITPLMLALILIEISDVIFAVDSVPAIFAITKEPLIVFTSNIFAILGLRSMYFIITDILSRFHLIKYGLGCVLIFVGLKMAWLNDAFGGKFPVTWSLGIILGFLSLSMVASLIVPAKRPLMKL